MKNFNKLVYALLLGIISLFSIFCYVEAEEELIGISFYNDENNLSDYYSLAGDGFNGNLPYHLFSGEFQCDDDTYMNIESISGFVSVSIEGATPNTDTSLYIFSNIGGCDKLLFPNISVDDLGYANILIDLSNINFKGCVVSGFKTPWNIRVAKSHSVNVGTVMNGVSLFIDSITYKDENDEEKIAEFGYPIQGSSIHFVEKDPYAPKIIFHQPSSYVANDVFMMGNGPFDALGMDGYEVPIISSEIELLNTGFISTYRLSGSTTIYIDNAIPNKMVNSAFYFKVTFGSCDFVTNRGETTKLDENGHAELRVGLSKSSCRISQENNTFKITAIARGAVKSGTRVFTNGYHMGDITYYNGPGYGTIEIDEIIPGTEVYFIKETGEGNNGGVVQNSGGIVQETGSNAGETGGNIQTSTNNNSFTYDYSKFNSKYSDELNRAYQYSYHYGITTQSTIDKANMNGGLTRIAMAKMLSNYAMSVLGKTKDNSKICAFNDVSLQLDAQYDDGVTNACKLGIMGVGITNFRPYDSVTRAEFATALSRLLYNLPDGKDRYYSTHLSRLKLEGIISNTDPSLGERRGYVMLMLMRAYDSL